MDRSVAAHKAWEKRHSPAYRARKTLLLTQEALKGWALTNGWRVVFLDAASGYPRIGIVDAVLVRVAPSAPDQIQIRLVQLKGGGAGLTGAEIGRLKKAAKSAKVDTIGACHDGRDLQLLHIT